MTKKTKLENFDNEFLKVQSTIEEEDFKKKLFRVGWINRGITA